MRHFLRYDLTPILSMAAVCAFPCIFLYAQNAAEVSASTMLPFLLVFGINAAVFCGLGAIFFRNLSRAAFWTDAAMLVVINFCFAAVHIKEVLPWLRDRYLMAILAVLLLALFVLLLKKKPDLRTGCALVLIAFGSMMAINLIHALPVIVTGQREEIAQSREEHGRDGDHDGGHDGGRDGDHDGDGPDSAEARGEPEDLQFHTENRPNVYYFLFDEYGGYDNLEHYYDYDNEPFLKSLEDKGFSVSYHSHNTEAVATDTIVPNLLNLGYVVRVEDSGHKKAVFRNDTLLSRMFRANGYQVNLINHVDYLGAEGCRVLTHHQTRRTISEFLLRNSLYNKFEICHKILDQFFVLDYGANYRASLDDAMDAELGAWKETGGMPTLTIGYLQCPHSPTMVGPHGENLPFSGGWNWRDHSLYLGQLQFISDFIGSLADTLEQNDPDAVIIFQSDHGNRYAIHMVQLGQWESYDPHAENQYMQNILNCVYYKGEPFNIEGQTGINTLRSVFSEVFGADLPPVDPVQDYSSGYQDEHS